jgi:hypothetical protein
MSENEIEVVQEKGLIELESAKAIGQLQSAMAVAKRFPRDEVQAMSRITAAAGRRRLAEQAEYQYAKGGTSVAGPSIRAAEAIGQAWGNLMSGVTEVRRDPTKKESVMLAYAGDLETNTWKFLEFTVPHTIDTRNGAKELSSSRDIYERVMNDGARRLRNCLLSVIPGDVVETFLDKCNETLSKDEKPLKDRIAAMLKAMEEFKVTKPMIENQYQCKSDAISERQLASLRRIYQSLKDGFGKIEDYFKVPQGEATTGKAADLNAKVKQTAGPTIKANPVAGSEARQNAPEEPSFDNFEGTKV